MRRSNLIKSTTGVIGACVLMAYGGASPAWASEHVTVHLVDGNPTCEDLDSELGLAGLHELKIDGGEITDGDLPIPGSNAVIHFDVDGGLINFDWQSPDVAIKAVIAKGGNQGANVYVYDPESNGWEYGLHTPTTGNPGNDAQLSNIKFCYYKKLGINKSADGSYDSTITWTIDKSVTPASADLFIGQSQNFAYTVMVDKMVTPSNWAVAGNITITNPWYVPVGVTVNDTLDNYGAVSVDCDGDNIATVPAATSSVDGELICSYSASPGDGDDTQNTVTVATTGPVAGGTKTVDIVWTENVIGDPDVEVTDTNAAFNGPKNPSDDATYNYTVNIPCSTTPGDYISGVATPITLNNTATITETGDSDSESVTLNCYAPVVAKTANPSITPGGYTWQIDKTGPGEQQVDEGETFDLLGYTITLTPTQVQAPGYSVSGTITVNNPNTYAAMSLTSVTDALDDGTTPTPSCPSLVVAAGGSIECTYSADVSDTSSTLNTATVSFNGYDFTGTDSVGWPGLPDPTDECIIVTDDNRPGWQQEVCVGGSYTINYDLLDVGPYQCETPGGEERFDLTNTASFTAPSGASGSDDHVVPIVLICGGGGGFPPETAAFLCRVTGGGTDRFGNLIIPDLEWENDVRHTFGGQFGAHTTGLPEWIANGFEGGLNVQPYGEWQHHYLKQFSFHGGTASAPQYSEITEIVCSDFQANEVNAPYGACHKAQANGRNKQIDAFGIGTFRNIGSGKNSPVWSSIFAQATAESKKNADDLTYHAFEVNIDDLGEPGSKYSAGKCPEPEGYGRAYYEDGSGDVFDNGDAGEAGCDCGADFYRITIWNGLTLAQARAEPDCLEEGRLNRQCLIDKVEGEIIYQGRGYLDGGNLQLHVPTGFDLKDFPELEDFLDDLNYPPVP